MDFSTVFFFSNNQAYIYRYKDMYNVSIGRSKLVKSLSILETFNCTNLHMIVQSVIAFAMNSDWFIML